ncbi:MULTISPECIES: hypothetical protein [unclassified Lentimonas]|nr:MULTISPECIES: hypothetical protein [unclassified Lentimonas]
MPPLFSNKGRFPKEGEAGMRVVAYMNGHTEAVPEADFIKRINNQTQ